jgi:hypothetical protein
VADEVMYKIHPAIGIARLGNAPADTFFIGPEIPGRPATGEPPGTKVPDYKDGGMIKPQAARFRLWEYRMVNKKWTPQREVSLTDADVLDITWTVHLANRKASFYTFDGLTGDPIEKRTNLMLRNRHQNDRRKLEIDPGPRSIQGKGQKGVEFRKGTQAGEQWPDPPPVPPIEYLGELRTDDQGRLVVIGGKGVSGTNAGASLVHFANNDNWFDDVSDGPVSATVTLNVVEGGVARKRQFEAVGSWVLVGPPDFAPTLGNVVTLYDTLLDVAARQLKIPSDNALYDTELLSLTKIHQEFRKGSLLKTYQPAFETEIYPILQRALDVTWLFQTLKGSYHSTVGGSSMWLTLADPSKTAEGARRSIFDQLRPPTGIPFKGGQMPKLLGDEPFRANHPRHLLALTHTQYALLFQWAQGSFTKATGTIPPQPKAAITPAGLDKAALENCVGGAFYPGMEVSWQVRHPGLFLEPFRINPKATGQYLAAGEGGRIRPGHFTRQMAVPWQADFRDCSVDNAANPQFAWWPGQRPVHVLPETLSDLSIQQRRMQDWHRPTATWPTGVGTNHLVPAFLEMVQNWYKFGFIYQRPSITPVKSDAFLEHERAPSIP